MKSLNSNNYSHIFIDESGEFGFGPKSTDNLVIMSLSTNNPRRIEKIAIKAWRALPHLHKHHELHANEADERSIRKVLNSLIDLDIKFNAYTFRKRPDQNIHSIYYSILATVIRNNKNAFSIQIDKRDTNKKRKQMINNLSDYHIFNRVEFVDSRAVKQIQIVDFASWAVFQDVEFGITSYREIIDRILEVKEWKQK